MECVRCLALSTAGAFELLAVAARGPQLDPLVAWSPEARPLSLAAPLHQALLGLRAHCSPLGVPVARYWLTAPPGTPPTPGASGDLAVALAVLLARQGAAPRPGAAEGGRWVAASGAFELEEGVVRMRAVSGWEEKLAGLGRALPPGAELRLFCPAEQREVVAALLPEGRVSLLPVSRPDQLLDGLAGWVEPARVTPAHLPSWGLRVAEAVHLASEGATRAGRAWVAVRDLGAALLLLGEGEQRGLAALVATAPVGAPLPAEGGASGPSLTPGAERLFRSLAAGAPLSDLAELVVRALDRSAGRPALAALGSGTGLGGQRVARSLEVGVGPDEGLSLRPAEGEVIGRHRREGGPDLGLFRQRERGVDLAVHGRHLRWCGGGVVEGVHPWDYVAAGSSRRARVGSGERIHLVEGDEVWLSSQTVLFASGD